MSDIRTWPAGLQHKPIRAGYKWTPHDPQSRVPMEQGPARKRRRWVESPAYVELVWPFALSRFEVFRAWHHLQLDDGANWFRMPVWTGNAFVSLPCRFKGAYEPALRGLEWWVSAEVEVRQVPYLDPVDYPDLLTRAWPEDIETLPLRDSYRLTPHRPVIRGDIDGPQDTKLWYQDGASASDFQWVMTGAQFNYWRSWYHHGLKDGVAWFTAPAWLGGNFGTRRCRFEAGFEAQLQLDYSWLILASVEMRDLPYLEDGVLYAEVILGEAPLVAGVAGIHHFVHTTYPEATT